MVCRNRNGRGGMSKFTRRGSGVSVRVAGGTSAEDLRGEGLSKGETGGGRENRKW